MIWGLALLPVNHYAVLPLVDRSLKSATSGISRWWLVARVMSGVALGQLAAPTYKDSQG